MIYRRFYSPSMVYGKDKADLIEQNEEYAEINEVLADYETCLNVQESYFCDQTWVNEDDPEFREASYDYNVDKVKKCAEFMLTWEQKREKIIARKKKDSYFTKTSRIKDSNDLKYGDKKFDDLTYFAELDEKFESMAKLLKPSKTTYTGNIVLDHIKDLYDKRNDIEKAYVEKNKGSQQTQPGDD